MFHALNSIWHALECFNVKLERQVNTTSQCSIKCSLVLLGLEFDREDPYQFACSCEPSRRGECKCLSDDTFHRCCG